MKRNGTLKSKQAKDVVYESLLLHCYLWTDKLLAEPWPKPGLYCRWRIGTNWVSRSTTKRRNAKASGSILRLSDLFVTCFLPVLPFYSKTRGPGCP